MRRMIFWAVVAAAVNLAFLLWFLSIPNKPSCDGLVGLAFDNCRIGHSGHGLTIGVIVFAWGLADIGLAALTYTSWTRQPIGSEDFRRYGGFWGMGGPLGWIWWFRTRKLRHE